MLAFRRFFLLLRTGRKQIANWSHEVKFATLLFLSVAAAAEPTPQSMIEQAIDGQRWRDKCTFTVLAKWDDADIGPLEQESQIRFDGTRCDVYSHTRAINQPASWPGNVTHRNITTGEWYFGRTTSDGKPKITGIRSALKAKAGKARSFQSSEYGFQLDGYFPGNEGKSLMEILRGAVDLVGSKEDVSGRPCVCLSATTSYGYIKICLDPEMRYALRSAIIKKSSADSHWADLGEGRPKYDMWSAELHDVSIDQVGEFFIPIAGTVTIKSKANNRSDEIAEAFSRSKVDLDPTFEGTDSFQMDFDDNAILVDYDNPGSPIRYVWNKGNMEPEGVGGITGSGARPEFQAPAKARSRVWWVVIANVLFLSVFIIWYLAKRASSPRG